MTPSSREDHLLRQIKAIADMLARMLGFRQAGQMEEARVELERAGELLLGPQGQVIRQLDAASAARILSTPERVMAYAQLVGEEALQCGDATTASSLRQRALELVLEAPVLGAGSIEVAGLLQEIATGGRFRPGGAGDLPDLSRRLERAEGQSSADFVEAHARAFPGSDVATMECAGARALYDGPTSPVTQTFGLGLFGPVTESDLGRIESFYGERGAPVYHEVSPLADRALLALLIDRDYRPVEFTSLLVRPLGADAENVVAPNDRITVRVARPEESDAWVGLSARGWGASPELADFIRDLAAIRAERKSSVAFLAELEGEPIATGALSLCEGIGLLGGASTIPEARGQGAQLALLAARLHYAADRGCTLAMMGARPGSASERNALRQGFRIMYVRIKWGLENRKEGTS